MGLDDFMNMSGDSDSDGEDEQTRSTKNSSTSSDSNTDNDESQLLEFDNWVRTDDGEIKPRGPYGYESRDEYNKTVGDDIDGHKRQFKHKSIIFTEITDDEPLERGTRHRHIKAHGDHNCLLSERRELQDVPRECIMFDTGEAEKSDALDVLENRMGFRPSDEDEVTFSIFINTQHAVKAALAESGIDELSSFDTDHILKALHSQTYTQRFRQKDTGVKDFRHTDEIQMW